MEIVTREQRDPQGLMSGGRVPRAGLTALMGILSVFDAEWPDKRTGPPIQPAGIPADYYR
ncbi:hypothetical protein N5079_27205 [Planotetraspora sp. A-T 1434]|uniref:hypothetical protein n=1 Tax=Planotetraspora sp. A-T 1434 TaxID=2979219 RepID=UPI0021BFE98D|nr:hypothetical protein [Planotetraspora sp. A-T 1434]MCT9933906.1 hypothetical protein [Planotetraspora sp. A-T 1434]